MKQIIYIFCCLAVTLGLTAQTATKNYILTRTYTKDDGATSLIRSDTISRWTWSPRSNSTKSNNSK